MQIKTLVFILIFKINPIRPNTSKGLFWNYMHTLRVLHCKLWQPRNIFSCQPWMNPSREINTANDFQTLFCVIGKKGIKWALPSGPVILSQSALNMVDLAPRNCSPKVQKTNTLAWWMWACLLLLFVLTHSDWCVLLWVIRKNHKNLIIDTYNELLLAEPPEIVSEQSSFQHHARVT